MSDDKDVEIDPRFDPAFQRGFDQTIPIKEFVPEPIPRKAAAVSAPAAPAPAPVAVPTRAEPPQLTGPRGESVTVVEPDADQVAVEPVAESESDSNPARNPFLLLLGIVAIALIAAGIWLFVRSGDAFNSREVRSQGDYMSLDATIHMAPFIALLGAATAIGVVFFFASKWRKRP